MDALLVDNKGAGEVWMGASDLNYEAVWRWLSDNSIMGYPNSILGSAAQWYGTEPKGWRLENCAHLYQWAYNKFNDNNCGSNLSYICEHPGLFRINF